MLALAATRRSLVRTVPETTLSSLFVRAQACPTLCDPLDCSPPGSFVHGILQARTLAWVAISYSGIVPTEGSNPGLWRFQHWQADSLSLSHLGSQVTLFLPDQDACPSSYQALRSGHRP